MPRNTEIGDMGNPDRSLGLRRTKMPGMSLGMSVYQACTVCGQSVEEHAPDCLFRRVAELEDAAMRAQCPICHQNSVGINEKDYFECRACHAQFCSSEFVPGHDPALLKEAVVINWQEDSYVKVLVLPEKGDGKFPLDEALAKIREQLQAIRKTSP